MKGNKILKGSFIFNQLDFNKGVNDNDNFFQTIKKAEYKINTIKMNLEKIMTSPRNITDEDTKIIHKFSKRLSNPLINYEQIKHAKRESYLLNKDKDTKKVLNFIESPIKHNSNVSNTISYKTHFKNFKLCKPTIINSENRQSQVVRKKINLEISIDHSSRHPSRIPQSNKTNFPIINTSHISTLNTESKIDRISTKTKKTILSENSNFILKDLETIITDCSERQQNIKNAVAEGKKKSLEFNKIIESKIPLRFNVKESIGGFGSLKEKLRKGFYTINDEENLNSKSQRSYIYKTFDRDNIYRKNEELDLIRDEDSYRSKEIWKLKYGLSDISPSKKKKTIDENKEKIKKLTEDIEKSKRNLKFILKKNKFIIH